jgi:hypothetical protein
MLDCDESLLVHRLDHRVLLLVVVVVVDCHGNGGDARLLHVAHVLADVSVHVLG